jgi:tRNA nucleotidyltransferase/poly(A) polymerase
MDFRRFYLFEAEQLKKWQAYVKSNSMLRAAIKVLEKITAKGYEAYITGGSVRDIILGIDPHDIDIASNMPIEELQKLYKTYDIGKSKDFGIVVVREEGHSFEVAQFREDGEYLDGRRPESVKVAVSFEADAKRRDFTINAMAVDKDGNIIDYFDGQKDIKNKVLRTVGNPRDRFGEDHLRMMRAARFASRFDLEIDPETSKAVKDLAPNILKLSVERVKDEIWKAAGQTGDKFAKYLIYLDEMGILELILPEITKLKGMEQKIEHHPEGDVWQHILSALKANKLKDPLINIAILLHDVGKGITFARKPDGTPTYLEHEEKGIDLVNQIGDRLKFSNDEKEKLFFAVANHMKFHKIMDMKPSKIFKIATDKNWDVLVAVAKADWASRGEQFMDSHEFEEIVNKAIETKEKFGQKVINNTVKIVSGDNVMKLTGMKPGKQVGEIIKYVTEYVLDHGITDEKEIDKLIIDYYSHQLVKNGESR